MPMSINMCVLLGLIRTFPQFAQAYLSSFNGQRNIYRNQAGGGAEGLNFEAVKDIQIPITGMVNNKKSRNFLSAVDENSPAKEKASAAQAIQKRRDAEAVQPRNPLKTTTAKPSLIGRKLALMSL